MDLKGSKTSNKYDYYFVWFMFICKLAVAPSCEIWALVSANSENALKCIVHFH